MTARPYYQAHPARTPRQWNVLLEALVMLLIIAAVVGAPLFLGSDPS